jgi:WD40 repeat protein
MLRPKARVNTACPRRYTRWALGLTACAVVAFARLSADAQDGKPPVKQEARADCHGDPLPAGALARLGTVRWRHGTPVSFAAFTPDGLAVLTASQDNLIRLWDLKTGKELRRFEKKGADEPSAPANPQNGMRGGMVFVSGPYGQQVARSVALSPDGKVVASVRPNNNIQLWERATGKELRQIRTAVPGSALLFSRDGKILAGRGTDQVVHLWETATGKELRQFNVRPNDGLGGGVITVGGTMGPATMSFSPDGKTMATSDMVFQNQQITTLVRLWEVATGNEVRQISLPQPTGMSALAFAPAGKVLAIGGNNLVHLYDPDTAKEIRQITGLNAGVADLAFSPDGKTLASKAWGVGPIRLCDVATGKVVRRLAEKETGTGGNVFWGGYGGSGGNLAFSPDGKVLASGGASALRLWDTATGQEKGGPSGHNGPVTNLAVGPALLASKGEDGTIRLWDPATGQERSRFELPKGTTCIALAPDGRTVALGNRDTSSNRDTSIRVHDPATGKELHKLAGHSNGVGVGVLAFSPDSKTLASRGSIDNLIRLYDVASGKEVRQIAVQALGSAGAGAAGQVVVMHQQAHPGGVKLGLVFSPDGRYLASPGAGTAAVAGMGMPGMAVGPGGTLSLWDVSTGKEVRRIELPMQPGVLSFAFSPDGRVLATQNMDQSITLWEVASGKQRGHIGKAGGPPPNPAQPETFMVVNGAVAYGGAAPATLAFRPDGRTLAVQAPGGVIQLLDAIRSKEIGRLKGHEGTVTAVAFAGDGKALASGGSDTTILLWDMTRFHPEKEPRPGELKAAEVEALWGDLAGADAGKAFRAVQRLALSPGQVVPLLRARLRPAEAANPRDVRQWIADLDSPRFQLRQRATRSLEKLGDLAMPVLTKVLTSAPPLETKRRVEQLLDRLTGRALSNEQLRLVRAVEVLEKVGTPEAWQVLSTLTQGAAGALPTREAQAALDRLAHHPIARP